MKFVMLWLVAILPLGACATLNPLHRVELTNVPAPQKVIPAECLIDPVAAVPVAEPTLPPLPAATSPDYLAIRTARAEAAGLFYQGERDAIHDAYETNAHTQAACKSGLAAQAEAGS